MIPKDDVVHKWHDQGVDSLVVVDLINAVSDHLKRLLPGLHFDPKEGSKEIVIIVLQVHKWLNRGEDRFVTFNWMVDDLEIGYEVSDCFKQSLENHFISDSGNVLEEDLLQDS